MTLKRLFEELHAGMLCKYSLNLWFWAKIEKKNVCIDLKFDNCFNGLSVSGCNYVFIRFFFICCTVSWSIKHISALKVLLLIFITCNWFWCCGYGIMIIWLLFCTSTICMCVCVSVRAWVAVGDWSCWCFCTRWSIIASDCIIFLLFAAFVCFEVNWLFVFELWIFTSTVLLLVLIFFWCRKWYFSSFCWALLFYWEALSL